MMSTSFLLSVGITINHFHYNVKRFHENLCNFYPLNERFPSIIIRINNIHSQFIDLRLPLLYIESLIIAIKMPEPIKKAGSPLPA